MSDAPSPNPRTPERDLILAARAEAEVLSRSGDPPTSIPSDSLPGYRLLHEIHRGGQGVVYRAHQEATGRTVAVKVMREGPFAGPSDRARFEREVRLLAAVRHPNIVAIHDSGSAGGHFFFVMDYIAGESLDDYARGRNLDVEGVLRVFVKVCDAVNAAHLRGIVHRDLKPGNIRMDEGGEPYVLDFGLARGAGGGWPDSAPTAVTVTGQFVGSLQWASPEQTEGVPDQVDVRTDVYSLGVMLFQLLTGRFPYDVSGSAWQTIRNIREADPPRPSSLLAGIDDDVDTIVLRCLHKDRDRRYQTAGELARDVRHYLAAEAIEAKRDSTWYVLRKALRRHRTAAGVGAAGMLAVLIFSVTSFSLYRGAEAAREQAARAAARAEQTVRFLRGILQSIDPDLARGRDTTLLREALAETDRRIRRELKDQPLVAADVHETLGEAYSQLGDDLRAEEHHLEALALRRATSGDDHPAVEASMRAAALCGMRARSDYASAQRTLEDVLSRRVRRHPDGSGDIVESLTDLGRLEYERGAYDRAEEHQRRAAEVLEGLSRADDELRVQLLLDRSQLATVRADFAAADRFLAELQALLESDGDTSDRLAVAHYAYVRAMNAWHQGQMQKVRPLLTWSLDVQRRLIDDPYHVAIGRTMSVLGLYLHENEPAERALAGQYLKQGWEILTQRSTEDNVDVAEATLHYAQYLNDEGQWDEAEILFDRALTISRSRLGENGLLNAKIFRGIASLRARQGRYDESLTALEAALRIAREHAESRPRELAACLKDIGDAQLGRKAYAEAISRYCEAIERLESGADDVAAELLGECYRQRGQAKRMLGRYAEAAEDLSKAVALYRRAYGERHSYVATILNSYARTLNLTGESAGLERSEVVMREALDILNETQPGDAPLRRAEFGLTLGVAILRQGRIDEAEAVLREVESGLTGQPECSRLRTVCYEAVAELFDLKGDPARSAAARIAWGSCLLSANALEDAERQLLAAQRALQGTSPRDAGAARACAAALAELYERRGDTDKAESYRRLATSEEEVGGS